MEGDRFYMYETINSPLSLGGVQLKNRIIFAPTTMGLPKKEYYKKIDEIARGGCSMIIIGHAHECKMCAQLFKSDLNFKGMMKYIPRIITRKIAKDDLKKLLNMQIGEFISSLLVKDVEAITNSFGDAAVLAEKAGFDMVQIHGDRMCGSFSSSDRRCRSYKFSCDLG